MGLSFPSVHLPSVKLHRMRRHCCCRCPLPQLTDATLCPICAAAGGTPPPPDALQPPLPHEHMVFDEFGDVVRAEEDAAGGTDGGLDHAVRAPIMLALRVLRRVYNIIHGIRCSLPVA